MSPLVRVKIMSSVLSIFRYRIRIDLSHEHPRHSGELVRSQTAIARHKVLPSSCRSISLDAINFGPLVSIYVAANTTSCRWVRIGPRNDLPTGFHGSKLFPAPAKIFAMEVHQNPEFEKWWHDWVQVTSRRNAQLTGKCAADELKGEGESCPEGELASGPWTFMGNVGEA